MFEVLLKIYLDNMLMFNCIIFAILCIFAIICYIFKDKILELYKKNKEIINYIIVGVLTTIVSVGSYWLFRFIISNYIILSVISWILAVAFAYFANRKYVFESKDKNMFNEMFMFVSCRLLSLGLEVVLMILFVSILNINDMVSKIILQFIILITNYLLSKLIVFKKNI